MTDCKYDFNCVVSLKNNSKYAKDDFLKFYLENFDTLVEDNDDLKREYSDLPFSILDFKTEVSDNCSPYSLKPRFIFLCPQCHLTILIDVRKCMFNASSEGKSKIETGLYILKSQILNAIQTSSNNQSESLQQQILVTCVMFDNKNITILDRGSSLTEDNLCGYFENIYDKIYTCRSNNDEQPKNLLYKIFQNTIVSINMFDNYKKFDFNSIFMISDVNMTIQKSSKLQDLLNLFRYALINFNFIHVCHDDLEEYENVDSQNDVDVLKLICRTTGGNYFLSSEYNCSNIPYFLGYEYYDSGDFRDFPETAIIKCLSEKTYNIQPSILTLALINIGYIISNMTLKDQKLDFELILDWYPDVTFKIVISTKSPLEQQRKLNSSLFAYYCNTDLMTNDSKLSDSMLQTLIYHVKTIENLLYFVELFRPNSSDCYNTPKMLCNGFKSMLSQNDQPIDKIDETSKSFFTFWRNMIYMDNTDCLHKVSMTILLEHDYHLPEELCLQTNNKFNVITSRESQVNLDSLLKKTICSFVIKENVIYVSFLSSDLEKVDNNHSSNYFCLIDLRYNGDLEVNLIVNFLIYTPEKIVHNFLDSLVTSIKSLKFNPRGKQARPRHMTNQSIKKTEHIPPQQRPWEQMNCCHVLHTNLSNLIAKYNPIIYPLNHKRSLNNIARENNHCPTYGYLHNCCHYDMRVWLFNEDNLNIVFQGLIKARLQEGFHFAVSDANTGFINMVKEVSIETNEGVVTTAFIQYLIYTKSFSSYSSYSWKTHRIFTEVFVENLFGNLIQPEPEIKQWNSKSTDLLSTEIFQIDLQAIEAFVTFESFKIYPMKIPKDCGVKPNIASVINKSPQYSIYCNLLIGENEEQSIAINTILIDLFEYYLKILEFKAIDISNTECRNVNAFLKTFSDYPLQEHDIKWNCYFFMNTTNLVLILMPDKTNLSVLIKHNSNKLLMYVYGMTLNHISYLLEDRWTLKLPKQVKFQFPLNSTQLNNKPIEASPKKTENPSKNNDKSHRSNGNNNFSTEIERIYQIMYDTTKKLDSIYVLTFISSIHKNLLLNNTLDMRDLDTIFNEYCTEIAYEYVAATDFMNTICTHCFGYLKAQPHSVQSVKVLSCLSKMECEVKSGFHKRIDKRIRTMMSRYFKEIPNYPHILLYKPESDVKPLLNDLKSINYNQQNIVDYDDYKSLPLFLGRQISNEYNNDDHDVSDYENTSVSSFTATTRTANPSCLIQAPLFISINYSLKYLQKIYNVTLKTIPMCISELFVGDILTLNEPIDISKLEFSFQMIPMTFIDEEMSGLLKNPPTMDCSGHNNMDISSRDFSQVSSSKFETKKYLNKSQDQLLTTCKVELNWLLKDEIVNCLKYLPIKSEERRINPESIKYVNMVKDHIYESMKFLKQGTINMPSGQINCQNTELKFVFDFNKSKLLFEEKLLEMKFDFNYECYQLKKIGSIYCIIIMENKRNDNEKNNQDEDNDDDNDDDSRRNISNDRDNLLFELNSFPDNMDNNDIATESRMRVDSLCLTSIQTAADNLAGDNFRRCCSETKLSDQHEQIKCSLRNNTDKTTEVKAVTEESELHFNFDNLSLTSSTAKSGLAKSQTTTSLVKESSTPQQIITNKSSVKHKSPQFPSNLTPRRHRSGDPYTSTGNNVRSNNIYSRSDTPQMLHEHLSITAASSKGYEGDSSRVSDGDEYEIAGVNTTTTNSCLMSPVDGQNNNQTDIRHRSTNSGLNDHPLNCIAPFWLLFELNDDKKELTSYFHHTDNCAENLCEYCQFYSDIFERIADCVHKVNQALLLHDLCDKRMCKDILIQDTFSSSSSRRSSSLLEPDNDFYNDEDSQISHHNFQPNTFTCHLILKISFKLHDRLKSSTTNIDKHQSKIISSLRSNFENIAVLNRKNMLIFVDNETGGRFYCLMNEVRQKLDSHDYQELVQNGVLVTRSDDITASKVPAVTTNKDATINANTTKINSTSDDLSVKSAPVMLQSKVNTPHDTGHQEKIDILELSFYGIINLTDKTIDQIKKNFSTKIDSLVLRYLSDTIIRNSGILLKEDDINFLLTSADNSSSNDGSSNKGSDYKINMKIPTLFYKDHHYLAGFCYYLKQNMQADFITPKCQNVVLLKRLFADRQRECKNGELFLYIRTSAQGVANEVIALFTVMLMDEETRSEVCVTQYDSAKFRPDSEQFNVANLITENLIDESNNSSSNISLNINLWYRGECDLEKLRREIVNTVNFSIIDVIIEFQLLTQPISQLDETFKLNAPMLRQEDIDELDKIICSLENGESANLNSQFQPSQMIGLFEKLNLKHPLIRTAKWLLSNDYNIEYMVNDIVEGMNEILKLNVFINDGDSDESLSSYKSWDTRYAQSCKHIPGYKRSFVLIGRLDDLWRKYVSNRMVSNNGNAGNNVMATGDNDDITSITSQTSSTLIANSNLISPNSSVSLSKSNSKEMYKIRLLLKQLPFDKQISSNSNSHLPEFCNIDIPGNLTIPRQMLTIVYVIKDEILVYTYNCNKEVYNPLYSIIDYNINVHKMRTQFMNNIIHQKLGLFYESSNTGIVNQSNAHLIHQHTGTAFNSSSGRSSANIYANTPTSTINATVSSRVPTQISSSTSSAFTNIRSNYLQQPNRSYKDTNTIIDSSASDTFASMGLAKTLCNIPSWKNRQISFDYSSMLPRERHGSGSPHLFAPIINRTNSSRATPDHPPNSASLLSQSTANASKFTFTDSANTGSGSNVLYQPQPIQLSNYHNTRYRHQGGNKSRFGHSIIGANAASVTDEMKHNNLPRSDIQMERLYLDAISVPPLSNLPMDIYDSSQSPDIIHQHITQFIQLFEAEEQQSFVHSRLKQSISYFDPKKSETNANQMVDQSTIFSFMRKSCRVFHTITTPLYFLPEVRQMFKKLKKNKYSPLDEDSLSSSCESTWYRSVCRNILHCYGEYLQKEHGFQPVVFVNPSSTPAPPPHTTNTKTSGPIHKPSSTGGMPGRSGSGAKKTNNSGGSITSQSNAEGSTASSLSDFDYTDGNLCALFQKYTHNYGIQIIEAFIVKESLCIRLLLLEMGRINNLLVNWSTNYGDNYNYRPQSQKSILKDACKMCERINLTSFMYDYYVRVAMRAFSNSEENNKQFDVLSFMRDFIVLYDHTPLYSTSHVYLTTVSLETDRVIPQALFEFLVRHYEDYKFSTSHTLDNSSSISDINLEQVFLFNTDDSSVGTLNAGVGVNSNMGGGGSTNIGPIIGTTPTNTSGKKPQNMIVSGNSSMGNNNASVYLTNSSVTSTSSAGNNAGTMTFINNQLSASPPFYNYYDTSAAASMRFSEESVNIYQHPFSTNSSILNTSSGNVENGSNYRSIFCLTLSKEKPDSAFDLFIFTKNKSNPFPIQKIELYNRMKYWFEKKTVLPGQSSSNSNQNVYKAREPSLLVHKVISDSSASHQFQYQYSQHSAKLQHFQRPLLLLVKHRIRKYSHLILPKIKQAINDCHEDSLWYRVSRGIHHSQYQSQCCDILPSLSSVAGGGSMIMTPSSRRSSMDFNDLINLINSGDILDLLKMDPNLTESIHIAAEYLEVLSAKFSELTDDVSTLLLSNPNSGSSGAREEAGVYLVVMSKRTRDGFLVLKRYDKYSNVVSQGRSVDVSGPMYSRGAGYKAGEMAVELKAVFRTSSMQEPKQHFYVPGFTNLGFAPHISRTSTKTTSNSSISSTYSNTSAEARYLSSSLKDITIMLAEAASFCIWNGLVKRASTNQGGFAVGFGSATTNN